MPMLALCQLPDCVGLSILNTTGLDTEKMFTTNPDETAVHVTQWGWLASALTHNSTLLMTVWTCFVIFQLPTPSMADPQGESWPFFRPNFVNMETARKEMGVDEVYSTPPGPHVHIAAPGSCCQSTCGHRGMPQAQVIGFCPTGWMYEMKRSKIPVKAKGPSSIHLVPYSEHSSYNELREYVQFLKPHKVAFLAACLRRHSHRHGTHPVICKPPARLVRPLEA